MSCDGERRLEWTGRGDGLSVGNIWESIRPRKGKNKIVRAMWRSSIPKAENFLWRLWTHRLPTADHLHSRGASSNPLCQLCNECPEGIDHIFYSCRFSRDLMIETLAAVGGMT